MTTPKNPNPDETVGGINPWREQEIARSDEGPITTKELAVGLQEIGRATDALVRRVSGSGRDPSEHVLDESRGKHREESADGRQINIQCDRCGLKSPGARGVAEAGELAMSQGWYVSDEADHCPVCKDGARLLPGQSPGNDDVLPPELPILDQIFLTRLEWLAERIGSGATPVATILNARRSGHRPMLTDWMKEYHYDPTEWFAKVKSLRDQGHVHDVFWIAALDASDHETIAWRFVEKLFRLVRLEDPT